MDLDPAATALRDVLIAIEEGDLEATDLQHAYIQSAMRTLEQLADPESQTPADSE